jgi:hypothetical protein
LDIIIVSSRDLVGRAASSKRHHRLHRLAGRIFLRLRSRENAHAGNSQRGREFQCNSFHIRLS